MSKEIKSKSLKKSIGGEKSSYSSINRVEEERKGSKNMKYVNYAKYTSLAFEMMFSMGLCAWAGNKLDKYLKIKYPVFLAGFSIISLISSIVVIIQSTRNNRDE